MLDTNNLLVGIEASSLLAALLGGFIATLTPCVYPLIPITLSIVGASTEVPRAKAILRASIYCLGIFLSYTLLGTVAVLSGSLFGEIWASPAVEFAIGLMLCGYALLSLDLVLIKNNGRMSQSAAALSANSAVGAFAAGGVSAILAAPCTGALLAAILTLAASSPNPTSGILLMLAYAAGFSTPFFILALSPQLFRFIPRSGSWLYAAKFIIGLSLLALGFNYLGGENILVSPLNNGGFKILLIVISALICILTVRLGMQSYINESRILRFFAALTGAIFLLLLSLQIANFKPSGNNLGTSELSEALINAKSENSLVVMEFTADWCIKCKELARDVFSKSEVKEQLSSVQFVVVDLSQISDSEKELQRKYAVRGLPAIIFLCPSSAEISVPRINEVIDSAEFIEKLAQAKEKVLNCP